MKKNKLKNLFAGLFYTVIIFIFLSIFIGSLTFIYFAKDLPRPESFIGRNIDTPTRIYDRTGENLLYTIHGEERREIIDINQIPEHTKNALITAEDSRFYSHFGIDIEGIGRAVITNIKEWGLVAGGSTISQQLIRNSLLTQERTFIRKIRELILTLELERKYSKEEILEFYFNQVPFGHNIYGIETASQNFFNKNTSELTLAESATLAAMIKSPSSLSPYGNNLNALIGRRDYILKRMSNLGYINEEEKEEALAEEADFSKFSNYLRAPHFVLYIKEQLENKYGKEFLSKKGLKIYTTLDFDLQKKAERIINIFAERNSSSYNAHNMATVIMDPKTGEVISMVGSADYFGDKYPEDCIPGKSCLFDPYTNVATRGRQPGSSFKPFVYAEAFTNGYDGETTVIDERKNFGSEENPYIPKNYDEKYRGEVTLRNSLAQSLNVPAVKVLKNMAGLEESIEFAEDCGITTFDQDPYYYGLPLVLGGGEVKLLELTSAYGVFANSGLRNQNSFILKIEDSEGNIIEKNNSTSRRVLSSSVSEEITDILSDNKARTPMFGSNSLLHFEDNRVAVKTGTTQNYRDSWTLGYTPEIVIGVWAGNNNNVSMLNGSGLTVAGPAWRTLMETVINNY